jgi:hypothetical protein
MNMIRFLMGWVAISLLAACASPVERGHYLVDLLSCASCHTDGQLINAPVKERYLAGSSVGIAYSDGEHPGVVFPANLTPDPQTGLGRWTAEEITRNVRYGIDKHGRQQLPIMPWPGYAHMDIKDAKAITAYLMSIPPVKHQVPTNVAAGGSSTSPYVRYGVYVFQPAAKHDDSAKPVQPPN